MGAGRWGTIYANAIARLPGVRLHWVCARRPQALTPPLVPVVRDWREALDVPGTDGVVIATGPEAQPEILMAALDRGMPALAEKPLALSLAQARALHARWRETGSYVLVDHIHLFHPAYRKLREAIRAGGRVRSVRSAGGNVGPYRLGYSSLWDYGPHDVSLCLDLLGEPLQVNSVEVIEARGPNGEKAQNTRASLITPSGVPVEVACGNHVAPKVRRFEVETDRGVWVMDDLAVHKLTLDGARVEIAPQAPLDQVIGAFARRDPAHAGLDLALAVTEVLNAIEAKRAIAY